MKRTSQMRNKYKYLLVTLGIMLTFVMFNTVKKETSLIKGHCPEYLYNREMYGSLDRLEQYSGQCFLLGGIMNQSALRLSYTGPKANSGKRDYSNRNTEIKTGVLFTDFINMRILKRSQRLASSTINNYTTLINTLKAFEKQNETVLYTNCITEEFLEDFIQFLYSRNLKQNYVAKQVEQIKGMIGKAGSLGYDIDSSYDDVKIAKEKPFKVFLSANDIAWIYRYKGLSKIQEQQRDLFVVGCWTGMRYSDYSTLTSENFQNGFIEKLTKKTGEKVIIPVHDFIKEIYAKRNGDISRGTTVQQFDRIIKVIMKKIGFDKQYTYTYTRAGKTITETRYQWELISSHTARRSFATNMYLSGRMKLYQIMACTGHRTEKSFFEYLGINKDEIAQQIAGDIIWKA